MRGLALVFLVGCADGPNPETVIDELRIVGVAAEPPVTVAGQAYTLSALVADPVGAGAELLVWSCPPEGSCDQAVVPIEDEVATVTWTSLTALPVWFLSCAPGVCGDLEAVPPSKLRDPSSWLATLPLEGVSAAVRMARVSDDVVDKQNPAPVVAPEAGVAGAGNDTERLRFVAPGAVTAYGFSTTGGFTRPGWDVASDGAVTLDWIPDKTPATGRVYVVLDDGEGGTAMWARDAQSL